MKAWRWAAVCWLVTFAVAADARDPASLLDVDVLPPATNLWVASLHFSHADFEISKGELGGTRYFLDISPATWLGGPVARSSQGGVTAWRWAEFSEAPPTVRIVVEHRSGWSCAAQKRGQAVEVSCRRDAEVGAFHRHRPAAARFIRFAQLVLDAHDAVATGYIRNGKSLFGHCFFPL